MKKLLILAEHKNVRDFLCENAYTKNTTEGGELYSTYKAQNSNLSYMDPYGYADEETICLFLALKKV